MIQDQRVATSYAIEALRIFDHLHFRVLMEGALGAKKGKSMSRGKKPSAQASETLTLKKPTAISGKPAWFPSYYKQGSDQEADRLLFSQ